jgi:hypothetical protein
MPEPDWIERYVLEYFRKKDETETVLLANEKVPIL